MVISLGVFNLHLKAFHWGKFNLKKCSGRQGAPAVP
jgi:hypothetical protein